MQKVIATPPGQPPIYVDLTEEELAQKQADQAAWQAAQSQIPLSEQLDTFFRENLPEEAQADFAPLRLSVKDAFLEGKENIAKLIIQRATIPLELEPLRTQLLGFFPN